jgi:hypothetical protein
MTNNAKHCTRTNVHINSSEHLEHGLTEAFIALGSTGN